MTRRHAGWPAFRLGLAHSCVLKRLQGMERIARDRGLTHLELHSSVNAEPFYAALGYEALEREEHSLRSGYRMVALRMRKSLNP